MWFPLIFQYSRQTQDERQTGPLWLSFCKNFKFQNNNHKEYNEAIYIRKTCLLFAEFIKQIHKMSFYFLIFMYIS